MVRNRLALAVCALAAAIFSGCSGGSSGRGFVGTTAGGSAAVFSVVQTAPADGDQNVAVDATFFVTFNEDVAPGSLVPGSITLQDDVGPVDVTLSMTTARVVSAQPTRLLTAGRPHLLRITTAVMDVLGRALDRETLVTVRTSASGPGGPGGPGGPTSGAYRAGAAVADITPPVGVPLAGYGGGDRRHLPLPDFNPFNFHFFMSPSRGIHDPINAKALVIEVAGQKVCIVTLDLIGSDVAAIRDAHRKAAAQGFTVPLQNVLVCSSHTHSGPGTLSRSLMWQVITADLFQPSVYDGVTGGIARAMVDAERDLSDAVIGTATTQVLGATKNRRSSDSPDLDVDSIDPDMTVLRVDRPDGTPVATVWNFAIHGTHFGTDTHDFSADIMGGASIVAESAGAGIAMFMNAAEGDIKPTGAYDATSQLLAAGIMRARAAASTRASGVLHSEAERLDLGQPILSLSLNRHIGGNIQSSFFIQALNTLGINIGIDFPLPAGWVDREFRFQAIRIDRTVIASMPGEPIHAIGLALRQNARNAGFDHVMPAGLANGHGSYFTTQAEYGYGGYEGLASFFGPRNGDILLDYATQQVQKVKP